MGIKFLYICRTSENKKLEDYIEIAEKLRKFFFFHIGGGNEPIIQEQLEKSRIITLGNVSEITKKAILSICDGYISTTIFEGFNHPILEAIKYNKVVFARPIKVHKELFGDYPIYCKDVSEFIINIDNWVKNGSPKPNQKLRKKILNRFKWENSAKKLEMVIDHLISS